MPPHWCVFRETAVSAGQILPPDANFDFFVMRKFSRLRLLLGYSSLRILTIVMFGLVRAIMPP
jgi:hypothetical protein